MPLNMLASDLMATLPYLLVTGKVFFFVAWFCVLFLC